MGGSSGSKFFSNDSGAPYAYTPGFKNGDVITVIKEGKNIKFMKNEKDFGVAFTVTSDELFFPAVDLGNVGSSFTILSDD